MEGSLKDVSVAMLVVDGFEQAELTGPREFVRAMWDQRKPVAVICHGPWLLASAGLLQGRTLTSWPSLH